MSPAQEPSGPAEFVSPNGRHRLRRKTAFARGCDVERGFTTTLPAIVGARLLPEPPQPRGTWGAPR